MTSAGLAALAVALSFGPTGTSSAFTPVNLSPPALSLRGADQPRSAPAPRATHRLFDTTNIVLTVVESGALLADGITTQRALHKYPDFAYEGDPLARPFVAHGWPGQVALGALVISADLGLRYLLHRANHHRMERWIPVTIAALTGGSAIHNAWLIGRIGDDVGSPRARR
jgi:hypothetical protein